ncbi:MAG: putative N-methylproline demethylase [Ilumatobacteraceae bacterium]|nr:putative N-methylproline demethylase [Ilumatobacteraceae bacterium]
MAAVSDDPLLQPFTIKSLTLKNRVMSSSHEPAYGDDGMPKEKYRLYHAEKAKGGMGLTMTAGSAVVSPDSPAAFGNLHAYKDEIIPWIRELTDAIHEHGCAAMIQISHLGRRTGWNKADWLPLVAPSAIREPAHRAFPKQAEDWDIERIIGDYATAAARMEAGGMDGIEIECYGHLMDGFWSPATNHRDDEYGGSFENRIRFGRRVLEGIRAATGPDFIVGLRMAVEERVPEGLTREDGMEILDFFDERGLIDFVNVIRGHIESDAALVDVIPIHGMRSAPSLEFAGQVKAGTTLAVMHASKIDDVATARHSIREGLLDLVGMTRSHIADPHIVRKIMEGREAEIRPCVGATYCLDRIYEAGEALCIHNASTGREATMPHEIPRAPVSRRVVVIGAGPGGLEAARVSAERGHDVVLLEAMPQAGGQIRLAVRNTRRRDLIGIVDWRVAELARLGVDVRYDTYADGSVVTALNPDVVIVATGGYAQLTPLESGAELVTSSWDILSGEAKPAPRVLLFDDNGAHPGVSAAEIIVNAGSELEFVTPERFFAPEVGGLNHVPYAKALTKADARMSISSRLVSVRRDGDELVARIGNDYGEERFDRRVDQVVVEYGTAPLDELYFELKEQSVNRGAVDYGALMQGRPQELRTNEDGAFQLFRIGDAVASRNIHAAIYDAFRLCKDL